MALGTAEARVKKDASWVSLLYQNELAVSPATWASRPGSETNPMRQKTNASVLFGLLFELSHEDNPHQKD